MARAGPVKELGLFKETVSVYSAITSRGSGVRQAFKKTAVRWAWWREGRAWALEGQTRSRPSSLLLLDVPPVFKRLQRFPCPAGQRCRLSGPRGVGATCTHCSLGFSAITLTSAPSTWPLFHNFCSHSQCGGKAASEALPQLWKQKRALGDALPLPCWKQAS